ncbi:MAG TPA: phosphoribosyltransferase family protein [Gaiellaceae bacterium]|nr:phosphoribosyltransferase family protein [Gaiellaceae bacterium]
METISTESTGFAAPPIGAPTLFEDRLDAGRQLVAELRSETAGDAVVVALSHGGVAVGAEIAHALRLPLDLLVVRKIRYPGAPERVLGAVAPGYITYVYTSADLSDRRLAIATADARIELEHVDDRLHRERPPIDVSGREVLLVDDGMTTGARMITATRWARIQRARRVIAAVPVGSAEAADLVRAEVDLFICPHELSGLGAVGIWYEDFEQPTDDDVRRFLDEHRQR